MRVRKQTKRRHGGFSLLELLAVITLLGVIAVVVIPRIQFSATAAKTNVHLQNVAELNSAIERYYLDTDTFPSADMHEISNAFPGGLPKDPRTDPPSDYTMDVANHRVPQT